MSWKSFLDSRRDPASTVRILGDIVYRDGFVDGFRNARENPDFLDNPADLLELMDHIRCGRIALNENGVVIDRFDPGFPPQELSRNLMGENSPLD